MSFVAMKNMQLMGRYLNRLNSNVKTEFQIQATPFNLKRIVPESKKTQHHFHILKKYKVPPSPASQELPYLLLSQHLVLHLDGDVWDGHGDGARQAEHDVLVAGKKRKVQLKVQLVRFLEAVISHSLSEIYLKV